MARHFDLDSMKGPYDAFDRDRDWLRERLGKDADKVFREGCEEIALTREGSGMSDERIGGMVMRILRTNFGP